MIDGFYFTVADLKMLREFRTLYNEYLAEKIFIKRLDMIQEVRKSIPAILELTNRILGEGK